MSEGNVPSRCAVTTWRDVPRPSFAISRLRSLMTVPSHPPRRATPRASARSLNVGSTSAPDPQRAHDRSGWEARGYRCALLPCWQRHRRLRTGRTFSRSVEACIGVCADDVPHGVKTGWCVASSERQARRCCRAWRCREEGSRPPDWTSTVYRKLLGDMGLGSPHISLACWSACCGAYSRSSTRSRSPVRYPKR
jgi:hypothetical protein